MEFEPKTLIVGGGLIAGVLFGALVQASSFCFRSAVLEVYSKKVSKPQLSAWVVAILIAIIGTQWLANNTGIQLTETRYLSSSLAWFGMIVGGVIFGIGAMLTRGCGGRLAVLAATGNLRALVVLFMFAITAYASLRGILAIPRLELMGVASVQSADSVELGLVQQLSGLFGATEEKVRQILIVLSVLSVAIFSVITFRRGVRLPLAFGLAIGLVVVLSWWVTGVLAYDDFDPRPAESVTFAATLADTLQFLIIYTGVEANFGVALVGGVFLGAFLSGLIRKELSLQGFSEPAQMVRYLVGGMLMGFGSVAALGCTFGHGLSGLSTLSIGSIIVLPAIVVGMVLTQKWLDRRPA